MTISIDRAIEILDPEHREHYDGLDEVNEACRMGMEALQYRKAVQPITSYVENNLIWPGLFCPVCHNDLWQKRIEFCDKCGQSLTWPEDEEAESGR